MATTNFTSNDYYSASLTRYDDLQHLILEPKSIIFSIYCAGVAIECMLRAYITKYTLEFDSKHDLEKLYEKSQIASKLSNNEKEQLSTAIKRVNKFWNNNLRYTSEKRIKRVIAHEIIRKHTNSKDISNYIKNVYSDIFNATELIITKGKEKWT